MKGKNGIKKGIVSVLLFLCVITCGSTVYALVQCDESTKSKKLARIVECQEQMDHLIEKTSEADDAAQKELKEALVTVMDEKMELEIETDTYAYDEELKVSINSVSAAVADMEALYDQCPERLTKMEEKRLGLLKSLCADFTDQISFAQSNSDHKQLLEQFRKQVDKINTTYKRYQ